MTNLDHPTQQISQLVRSTAILTVRCYQYGIRPLMIGKCKFHPSCSDYAIEAIDRFGLRRGTWMGLKRIGRCHPFGPGGIDPVPKE